MGADVIVGGRFSFSCSISLPQVTMRRWGYSTAIMAIVEGYQDLVNGIYFPYLQGLSRKLHFSIKIPTNNTVENCLGGDYYLPVSFGFSKGTKCPHFGVKSISQGCGVLSIFNSFFLPQLITLSRLGCNKLRFRSVLYACFPECENFLMLCSTESYSVFPNFGNIRIDSRWDFTESIF